MGAEPSFTIGVEEEYHLVDAASGDLVIEQPDELLARCQARFGEKVTREFQQCQLEIATEVCRDMQQVRADLIEKRAVIAEVARQFGITLIAASTHPYGQWNKQIHTPKPRYDMLAEDMQIAARRLLICGMHVHRSEERRGGKECRRLCRSRWSPPKCARWPSVRLTQPRRSRP
jgi:carboxylate-amine ligase